MGEHLEHHAVGIDGIAAIQAHSGEALGVAVGFHEGRARGSSHLDLLHLQHRRIATQANLQRLEILAPCIRMGTSTSLPASPWIVPIESTVDAFARAGPELIAHPSPTITIAMILFIVDSLSVPLERLAWR